jgi:NADH-quinone oxidoreductase subunit G
VILPAVRASCVMSEGTRQEVPMVDVQIDGDWHSFPQGTRMIEALRAVGKMPPHYCYHPKLSSPGNCRMCLVEMGMPARPVPGREAPVPDADGRLPIGWMPRPVISCANTVAHNMGIRTESALVEECRHGVMEFLLINHPLDCPICDQAGECQLQEFSVGFGRGESRFREQKVKKPKNVDIGPRIRLDDERCVMCSRCVRFCEEIDDDPVLGFTDRGSHTVLAVHPGERLDSNYSLNTADICPVGALTSNDFRFQMRVWFLKETESLCVQCGRGCNTLIGSREDTIYRQTPRENNAVNSAWMCDQGRLDFAFVNSDLRLTAPILGERAGVQGDCDGLPATRHAASSWPAAIEAAARGLEGVGAGGLAIIGSARMTNEELWLLRRVARGLGARLIDVVPRTGGGDDMLRSDDRNPNSLGAKEILGIEPGEKLASIRERVRSGEIRALLVWQEDLFEEAGFVAEDLRGLDHLVVCQQLANATAEAAHVVLPGASYAEKRGSMINVTGRIQRLQVAVASPGEARDDWEILRDLASEIDGVSGPFLLEEVWKEMSEEVGCLEGLSFGSIGRLGVSVLETGAVVPLLEKERARRASGVIPEVLDPGVGRAV